MAKRRANGEGSIYQRPDGQWVGQYTVGSGKKKTVSGTTQREAWEKMKEVIKNLEAGVVSINIKLERELYEILEIHAVKENETLQDALVRLIKQGVHGEGITIC